MRNPFRGKTLILLGLLVLLAEIPALAQSGCPAPSSWFPHSSTPEPNFGMSFTSNCEFHQWAVQEFLYLTQDAGAGLARFQHLASPHALFLGDPPPAWPPPLPPLPPPCTEGEARPATGMVVLPRAAKDDEDFAAINQAGFSDVLIDQQGQVVYYAAHVNEDYYDFIRSNGYYTVQGVTGAAAGTSFPVGAVEVKSAWRIAKQGGTTYIRNASEKFYTIDAYVTPPGKSCSEAATLALVGLHVVGRVNGHPEFVWATFEHEDNAPDCRDTPSSRTDWSFYEANFDCGSPPGWSKCNKGSQTVTSIPSEVCQINPWGEPGRSGSPTVSNTQNIEDINASFHGQLDDVWKSYKYLGAQWTSAREGTDGRLVIDTDTIFGSTLLANTSAESFTQKLTDGFKHGCFSCHNTSPPFTKPACLGKAGKNIFVSHLLGLICSRPDSTK